MSARRVIVLCMMWLLASSSPVEAGPRKVKLGPLATTTDLRPLLPILQRGEISLVESDRGGRLRQVTVIGLVESPPKRVWQVLTDYDHYLEFMPNLVEAEVIERKGVDTVIAYELEVPGSNMEYTLRHHHVPKNRIEINLADDEGDITTGAWRWELIPHREGTQTMLLYTLYTDVGESSWVIRQALKSQPSIEHGLNVATGLMTLQAVAKRAGAAGAVSR